MSLETTKQKPVYLRSAEERYAHVAMRMIERGGLKADAASVAALEKRVKFARMKVNMRQPIAPVLPTKIGEIKDGTIYLYRVFVGGSAHTVVWSQICKGLVSYAGPGELPTGIQPATVA